MNNPFIPFKKADTIVVAGNISSEIYDNLKKNGLEVIKTIAHEKVHTSIKYHPDIVMHPIRHNLLIVEPSLFQYYKDQFKNTHIKIIKGEIELKAEYPFDIAYNVGRIGNYVIHNLKYTDEVLKYYLEKEDLEFINIKQGYSKCSMAIVGEKEIITSDKMIDKTLKDLGFNSLLIKPGFIDLENQNYGFIGGCTGNISNKEVLISGTLKNHPDKEIIEKFLKETGKKINYLSKEKITDIGTMISLNCN
ncbi:MAG: hypothetical protein GXY87_07940 [Tissierellia bacterium]|uniref:DUF6873 family GME fold protein n=1 Tax=Clostridium algidicarnis TaxID=37659 RepID=UPI0016AE28BE|nr:hypothetical protein [Clostridium algidicarnis]MBU3206320.1 hypothetical protein [Clostridium algidicarnis]NLW53266.1 hypothetical protein [Tissierellia bacterium]